MKRRLYLFSIFLLCSAGCGVIFPSSSPSKAPADPAALDMHPVSGHADEILAIEPVRGGFLTASKDGRFLRWEGSPVHPAALYDRGSPVEQAAIDPSHGLGAFFSDGVLQIVDFSTGQTAFRFDRMKSRVLDMDFAPDGRSILFGASDNRVYRWKFAAEAEAKKIADRQKAFERYNGPALPVSAVAYHPDGRIFFSGDWDGDVSGWLTYDSDRLGGRYDVNIFGPRFFSEGATRVKLDRGASHDAVQELRVSPDGLLLFAGISSGSIELWKIRGLKKGAELKVHSGDIFSVAVSPKGDRLVSAGRDGFVRVMRIRELPQDELKAKDDRKFDYDITVVKEIQVPDVRIVSFQDEETVLAGDRRGAVLAVPAA